MENIFEHLYKPDVLSCLADLSNDEVFTPPEVANKMLDLLPQELFRNKETKILPSNVKYCLPNNVKDSLPYDVKICLTFRVREVKKTGF